MIQLIDKQGKTFYMKIYGEDCVFMGTALFLSSRFMPLTPKVKGSTLHWYVNRKYVSYNQIKDAICTQSNLLTPNKQLIV